MARRKPSNTASLLRDVAAKGVAAFPDRRAVLHAIAAYVDAEAAKGKAPFDKRDSVRDRLFALLMQRIDIMQADRAAFVKVVQHLAANPADVRHVGKPLCSSLQHMLQQAGAPSSPAHTGALGIALLVILATWQNDKTADLSKTMKACDKSLALLERLARAA